MNTEKNPKQKTCPRCGRRFECLHNETCWCFAYVVPPENLEVIRKTYPDCLCPACLAIFAENKG
jgi:transposase